jgi:hypothetical protein
MAQPATTDASGVIPPRPVATVETPTRPAVVQPDPTPQANLAPAPPVLPPQPGPNQDAARNPVVDTVPKDGALPRRSAPCSSSEVTGIASLLQLVAPEPTRVPQVSTTSFYLPSFIATGKAVDACNQSMITTRKFTEACPQWHPYVTHLYISFCWYVKVFSVMEEDGVLSDDQLTCLLRIRNTINLNGLWIPGPLVPHFEALTLSAGQYASQGNISPRLPDTLLAIPNAHLVLDADIAPHLPHPLALLDQLHQVGQYTDAQASSQWAVNNEFTHLFAVPATDTTDQFEKVFSAPNFRSRCFTPASHIKRYTEHKDLLTLPEFSVARMASGNPLTWSQFLGLETIYTGQPRTWLSNVAAVMQTFCSHFNGSKAMSEITNVGIGSGQVECIYTGTAATEIMTAPVHTAAVQQAAGVAAVTSHYKRSIVTHFQATTLTRNPDLRTGAYQLGSLARTNAQISGQADPKQGEIWSNGPIHKRSSEAFDYLDNLAPHIAAYYHTATPLKKNAN